MIGFALIMIATAVAMLHGRRGVIAAETCRSLPVIKILLLGLAVGMVTGLMGAGGVSWWFLR
jgi:uncharacterized membrane protein YfcA